MKYYTHVGTMKYIGKSFCDFWGNEEIYDHYTKRYTFDSVESAIAFAHQASKQKYEGLEFGGADVESENFEKIYHIDSDGTIRDYR